MQTIKFFFDFLSPYSYFAWLNHRKSLPEAVFEYHPLPMGKLFSHHKFPGPGEIPAKRDYELKKCFRYAADNQIEFRPPAEFPFNPIAILRMATKHAAKQKQAEVIDLIFQTVWGEGRVLEDPEIIAKLVPADIFEASFSREARLELKSNIQQALSFGAFGVPSWVYQGELFWGNDNMLYLERVIKGNDNWNKELYDELKKK